MTCSFSSSKFLLKCHLLERGLPWRLCSKHFFWTCDPQQLSSSHTSLKALTILSSVLVCSLTLVPNRETYLICSPFIPTLRTGLPASVTSQQMWRMNKRKKIMLSKNSWKTKNCLISILVKKKKKRKNLIVSPKSFRGRQTHEGGPTWILISKGRT